MDEIPKFMKIFATQYNLTEKESEICHAIIKGISTNKDIAEHVNIAISTLEVHLFNIYNKINKRRKHEIVCLFLEFCIMENRKKYKKLLIAKKNKKNKKKD